jgi:hypothetical protein
MACTRRCNDGSAGRAWPLSATPCPWPGLWSPLEQGRELAAPCQGRTVSLYTGRGGDIEGQHARYALKHGLVLQTNAPVQGDHLVGWD